jgi:hypothetical protein
MSTSRTATYQDTAYSRRRRLAEASSGDREHVRRVEAELERADRARRRPRGLLSLEEAVQRRHARERDQLGLPPLPTVPVGVLEPGHRDRGPGGLASWVLIALVSWVLIGVAAGATYYGLRALLG